MPVRLDVWSDYVCPFCYLEEPVLTKMQEQFGDQLAVHCRAFELRPDPVPTLPPRDDYLVDIWKRFLTSARDESAAQIWLRDLYAGAA